MSAESSFAPLHAATRQAINLSMQRLWVTGQILHAGARIVVQHVFRSDEEKPLEAIYAFPLPRDAALRRFRITGEGFEIHSKLKETEAAVKDYEAGIARGSLAALVRQYGDGLLNLTVGNIRPRETVTVYLEMLCGVELNDSGFRFRFPFTLAPAFHSRARTALTAQGEGEMELPGDEFGDVILPRFREDASALHQVGFELTTVSQLALREVGSPSHAIRVKQEGDRSARIALAIAKEVPNRDLIIDVGFQSIEPQVLAGVDKDGRGRFAAIVPSSCFGVSTEATRRVVMLLDRSGSMRGAPIEQASKAIDACLAALSETDLFGLAAFDNEVMTFHPELVPGTREFRDQAHQFLTRVNARGGTDLRLGLAEAARILSQQGGDVFVITDGQVAGTETILEHARSAKLRLHCLGIGSASQDRFLALLARETGGVSRFVTPAERVDLPAVDLFASVGRPVAQGLTASGNVQPEPPSSVFRGTPVLVFGETGAEGDGRIELTWTGGRMSLPIPDGQSDFSETLWLLQGSRLITDWDSKYPRALSTTTLDARRNNRVVVRLIELSRTYGLASREMSLVAVLTRTGDHAGELPETRVVPVGMPQDTSFGAYFGTAFAGVAGLRLGVEARAIGYSGFPQGPAPRASGRMAALAGLRDIFAANFTRGSVDMGSRPPDSDDMLLDLASRMDSDGGMPGSDTEARAIATVVALLAFVSNGHTFREGAFRSHVEKLALFLLSLKGLSSEHRQTIHAAISAARLGKAPAGEWVKLAGTPGDHWGAVAKALS